MFYTNVLRSLKDGRLYLGHAEDVVKRLASHNGGKVRSTKSRVSFQLIHKDFPQEVKRVGKRNNGKPLGDISNLLKSLARLKILPYMGR